MKWIALLLLSTSAFGAMSKQQVLQEMKEEGHSKHRSGPVFYHHLDEVIPKARQDKLKKRKKKKAAAVTQSGEWHVTRSWSLVPSAYAFGRKPLSPAPSPTPEVIPSPIPAPSPVVGGVDLRSRDGTVKDQIGPYCTAYGMAAAIENKLGTHEDLSERHIFSFYGIYSAEAAVEKVPGHLITTNALWPRENRNPYRGYLDQAKRKLIKAAETEDPKGALDRGNPVFIGMAVPGDMASCRSTIRPTTSITSGGHAVEVVGYEPDPNGYWILKNSWGTDCGDEGYQYMPFTVCDLPGMYCDFYEVSQVE